MKHVSEGWALELRGDAIDLDDLRDALKPPFEPWVEDYQERGQTLLLLRSRAWERLENSSEMMDDARRLLEIINGAHRVAHPDARPIAGGITFRFNQHGQPLPVTITGTMSLVEFGDRIRVRGRLGSTEAPTEPSASPMQKWIERANNDDGAADLLAFVARSDNWFDIYKAMECIKVAAGGASRRLHPDWERVWRTANCHRHAPSPKYPWPDQPVSISEAKNVLLSATGKVLTGQQA